MIKSIKVKNVSIWLQINVDTKHVWANLLITNGRKIVLNVKKGWWK